MIVTTEELRGIREQHAADVIVLTHGVYDIMHSGHIEHLEIAKSLGSVVAVALWCDDNVAQRKGPERPINSLGNRLRVMDALRMVDYVFEVPGVGTTDVLMKPILEGLQPDVYLLSDQHGMFGEADLEHETGRKTTIVYDETYSQKRQSTSAIVSKIRDSVNG